MKKLKYLLFIFLISPVYATEELTKEQYQQAYEEKVEQVKKLKWQLYNSDRYMSIGKAWYDELLKEVRELRRDNTGLEKQLHTARNYLEAKGIYINDITGKIYNETEGPLWLEKIARRSVEQKLLQQKAEHDLDSKISQTKISELNYELYSVAQERDKYKKQVEEDKRYFQALQNRK